MKKYVTTFPFIQEQCEKIYCQQMFFICVNMSEYCGCIKYKCAEICTFIMCDLSLVFESVYLGLEVARSVYFHMRDICITMKYFRGT